MRRDLFNVNIVDIINKILTFVCLFPRPCTAVLVCNGHGTARGGPGNSTLCVCQEPYTGDTCQTCNHGYYGNPMYVFNSNSEVPKYSI